jgi:hypothetical protein
LGSGFANRLNHQIGLSLVVGTTTTPLEEAANGQPAFADALPISMFGGNVCRIRLGSSVQINTYLDLALAHEVFHCFQYDLVPNTWETIDDWIMEGMADWAALSVDPVSYTNTDRALGDYLISTHKSLFSRDYDAVGFWGHTQDVTGNLWSHVAQILSAGGNGASYVAAVGPSDFLSSWGSSPFRTVPASTDWGMLSPISPPGPSAIPLGQKTILFGDGDVYADPWSTSQGRGPRQRRQTRSPHRDRRIRPPQRWFQLHESPRRLVLHQVRRLPVPSPHGQHDPRHAAAGERQPSRPGRRRR